MSLPNNNDIALKEKFTTMLDRKYKASSKTAFMDADPSLLRATVDAKTFMIPARTMSGLFDYGRNTGFQTGIVENRYIPFTFQMDRGTALYVDAVDNLETALLMIADLANQLLEEHVAPETDAYRLSKYANYAIDAGNHDDVGGLNATNVVDRISLATKELEENEAPLDSLIMFVTPETRRLMELNDMVGKSRSVDRPSSTAINFKVHEWNDMPIITVPPSRMATSYIFRNISSPAVNTADGGFEIASDARQIDFLIMNPKSAMQLTKRAKERWWNPDNNPRGDGYTLEYRIYHDAFVTPERAKGMFVATSPIT